MKSSNSSDAELRFVHDLSGPLMVAVGYTELLLSTQGKTLSLEEKEQLQAVFDSLMKLSEIIKKRNQTLQGR